jgi:hypothetical protein
VGNGDIRRLQVFLMAITSTVLANGQRSDVTHYNNLRSDLLTEHDHSAGKGGTVSHGDLSDGAITGTYLTHEQLNLHVQGAGTDTSPDDPGGSQGVHGLPSIAYVMGSVGSQLIMQHGVSVTDTTSVVSGSYVDQVATVIFPAEFGDTPTVYLTPQDSNSARVGATNISTFGFTALIGFPFGAKATGQYGATFSWNAIGPA